MAYYIRTTVALKMGKYQGYSDLMTAFAPYMAQHGWKLLFGLGPVVGDITEITHLWEIEKFEDIAKGMEACGADPEAHKLLANLPDLVHKETVVVMAKTPYSP